MHEQGLHYAASFFHVLPHAFSCALQQGTLGQLWLHVANVAVAALCGGNLPALLEHEGGRPVAAVAAIAAAVSAVAAVAAVAATGAKSLLNQHRWTA